MFFYVFLTTYCNDFVDLEQPYYRRFLDRLSVKLGGGVRLYFLWFPGGGGVIVFTFCWDVGVI